MAMNFKNLYQNEYSFEEVVNENFLKVDNFNNLSIKRKIYHFNEDNIEENKLYLISHQEGMTEDEIFKDKINQITCYNNNLGWLFYEPEKGNIAYLQSEEKFYYYNGTKWDIFKTGESQNNSGFSIGMIMKSYKTLSNDKWLRSAGQINDGTTYVNIYNELLNCWNNGTSGLAHIKGTNYTYKELNGFKVISNVDWQSIYSTIGIVSFFGIDTTNKKFYLPFVSDTKRILIDTKKPTEETGDNSRWYNLYSDGWLEQGGCYTNDEKGSNYTNTYLLPYKDTTYSLWMTQWTPSTPSGTATFWRTIKYVSGFRIGKYAYTGFEYMACGYSNQVQNFNVDYYNYFFIG